MNEGFSIRLRRGGKAWPIDSLTKDEGLVFDNEVDAFPRSLTLEFDGVNAATTYRMNRVRELRGWNAGEFRLSLVEKDGMLFASGVDQDALPSGYYWFWLTIDDVVDSGQEVLLSHRRRHLGHGRRRGRQDGPA